MSSSSVLAEHRHEDAPVLGGGALLEGLGRDREAAGERLALPAPVDHVQRDPGRHPAEADVARALVVDDDAEPHGDRERRPEHGRERHARAADRDRERHAEGARPVGLAEAERDHRQVREREGDHRAEREHAGEEVEVVRQREREREQRRDRDRHVRACRGAGGAGRPRSGSGGSWRASRRAGPGPASARSWPRAAAPPPSRRPRSGSRRAARPARTRTGWPAPAPPGSWSPSAVRVPTTGVAISARHRDQHEQADRRQRRTRSPPAGARAAPPGSRPRAPTPPRPRSPRRSRCRGRRSRPSTSAPRRGRSTPWIEPGSQYWVKPISETSTSTTMLSSDSRSTLPIRFADSPRMFDIAT